VPIQETATLYGKLQQAVRMLGGEQKDALTITESISQALRISGASATEAQSSLLQFGQALLGRAARRGIQLRRRKQPASGASWPMV
jgi:phage-related minor tail protein